jgi:phosphatidylglycerophosphate synthase
LITGYFATERFPSLVGLSMGPIIAASWKGKFLTATQMLQAGAELWGV